MPGITAYSSNALSRIFDLLLLLLHVPNRDMLYRDH
jgi:hypothetical protein